MADRGNVVQTPARPSVPLLDALCGRLYRTSLRDRVDICLSLVDVFAGIHADGTCLRSLTGSELLLDAEASRVTLADSSELCVPGAPVGRWLVWLAPSTSVEKDAPLVASVELDRLALARLVPVLLLGQEPRGDWSAAAVAELMSAGLIVGELPSEFLALLAAQAEGAGAPPAESEWARSLAWLRGVVYHTPCGHEIVVGRARLPERCPVCGAVLTGIPHLAVDDAAPLPASEGLRLYGCMLRGAPPQEAMRLVAEVVASHRDSSRLGLRNVSGMDLSAVKRSGEGRLLSAGSVMPLLPGATLHPYGSTVRVVAQEGDAHE